MKEKVLMLLSCFLLGMGTVKAQTSAVSGVVTSEEDGEPVVGASVLVKGTSLGTVTDLNGKFSIANVPASAKTLQVSFVGMQTQEVAIRKGTLRVVLRSDAELLDEVMVVAFGTQKKSSFTGSAAVVGAEKLSERITTNVSNALVGSVPGLQIRGTSGQPGSGNGSIHIRGIASMFADTDPLIIVDGAPYEASLANLPQDDIETITVLKDAASAALYGARGAAGVILITTKKGKTQKAVINVDMKWGSNSRAVQDYTTITDPAQFMEAYYSQFYNYAVSNGLDNAAANKWVNDRIITNSSWGLQYNPFTVPTGQNLIGLDGKLNPNAALGRAYTYGGETYYILPDNWKDAAYKDGFRQEYSMNLSGGTSQSSFYASAGYLNEDGIIDNSGYERFTGRVKADYQAKKWLRMGANVGFVHSNQETNPNFDEGSLSSTSLSYYADLIAPIYPLYVRTVDANGNPVIRTDEYGNPQYDYGVPATSFPGNGSRLFSPTGNPIGANKYNEAQTLGNQFMGTFTFDIDFTDWLKFSSNNNLNFGQTTRSIYGNPFYGSSASDNGYIEKTQSNTYRRNFVQTLTFHKKFGHHDVTVMAGHEWYKTTTRYLYAKAKGGFSPDIKEINAFATRDESNSYKSVYNVEGWFGSAQYDYNEKYFGSLSFRRDASSNFATDYRWGNFWSVGAAWIVSKENFMNDTRSWLDQLKLKASIGQQGNDAIGSFHYTDLYTLSRGEGSMLPSFYRIGNEDITWETTTNFNVGLEWSLWRGRLTGSLDFYTKKVADQLFWLNIPESYGARGYYENVGDIRNTGVELVVSGDVIRTKNITWNLAANISHNKTKILTLPESKKELYGGFRQAETDVTNVVCWYEEGKPLYNLMMPEFAGVSETGEALYWQDTDLIGSSGSMNQSQPGKNHSQTTTNLSQASYYTQGSALPKATGGFSTTLRLYDFDLSATFDYQIDGKIYDNRYETLMTPVASSGSGRTYHKDVLRSWTVDNPNSSIPRFQYYDSYTAGYSTRFLTNASYLNFQSFVVGYTLPKKLVRTVGIEKLRVYVQGENLCFWSKRKGLDPRYAFLGTNSSGNNGYSPTRTVMGGIQLSF